MSLMQTQPSRGASGSGKLTGLDVSVPRLGPPWLLKSKVVAPQPPEGYVRRVSLLRFPEGLLERRLTVLQAPAGFGKTAALADIAQGRKGRRLLVGWISLDGDDTPSVFGSYLGYAFEHAGVDLSLLSAIEDWSSSPAVRQIGMLARAIEAHGKPALLVLDEVDRLPRQTIHVIDLLLKHAPGNLDIAMAFRCSPGLDLTPHFLDRSATVIGAHHLRFSKTDIARFFDGKLSQGELAAVEEQTAGWPVALKVYCNTRADTSRTLGSDAVQLTENYIGVRLLRDLSAADRAALLELAVFDLMEANLIEEVLGSSDALVQVTKLAALDGLVTPVGGDPKVRRLHPLLQDYCLDLLSVADPDRKRSLHRRIALALARRGHLTPAWRHAGATGDGRFIAELIERFGVFELWLRDGVARLISAGRFLTPELVASYPRLGLLQCLILVHSSKIEEARVRFDGVAQKTDGFTRDRDGGDADALAVDRVFTQAVLAGSGDRLSPSDIDSLLPADAGATERDERARTVACGRHTLLCIGWHVRASFAESRRHGLQAQAHFAEDARYGQTVVNIYLGMSAMAQGRVQEASERYRRARRAVRKFFSDDPYLAVSTDVLTIELDLERNRKKTIRHRTLKSLLETRHVWSDIFAAAIAVSAELTFGQYDTEAVIQFLTEAVDDARATGIRSLSNHASALQAYYLVELGRPDEAERVWRDHQLPKGVSELLDLERQPWRTMEALSCARIRLLTERGDRGDAEELAGGLCDAASDHGLTRTLLRGLALSMVAAHHGGQTERARARLVEYIHVTREVDYVRPLVRNREVSLTLVRGLLDTNLDEDARRAAESTLAHLEESSDTSAGMFSMREREVLAEAAGGLQNKEIAQRLGISDEGIRYHLKNIYRKTGTRNRTDAVRYARARGVLS